MSSSATIESSRLKSAGSSVGRWEDVEAVWVLAGSAGAGSAVRDFLNAFTAAPPVAFIYALHFDPDKQEQLQQLTLENPAFNLQLCDGSHTLVPGSVIMVPPRGKVTIGSDGSMCSTDISWEQCHTPDIAELLVIFSAANLPNPGVIVFSGMGSDGTQVLNVLDAGGTRIWAQSPESAICSSMPQAAVDTGLVHCTGTPEELAKEFVQLFL